jgi:hypothetical protein
VLANFYLSPLDDLLRAAGVSFLRYMDDIAVVCPSFHEARQLLDRIEEALYDDGLSLGGGKTSISRSESVVTRLTPEEEIDELVNSLEDAGDYAPDEDLIEEFRLDQVCEVFDRAVAALESDEYRRSHFTFALRQLARQRHPHAIEALPLVLLRMPGLTPVGCRYLEAVSTDEHRDEVAAALIEIVSGRFHRTQEWLHLLRAIQVTPHRAAASLADELATMSANNEHPLVRARALLAWGRQSSETAFDAADAFFEREDRPWLAYAVIAVQGKEAGARDDRYGRWSGEGRRLARLIESVQVLPFGWTRL